MKHGALPVVYLDPALQFPPVNSGGLIEARSASGPLYSVTPMFPPVNSGGLIEAG